MSDQPAFEKLLPKLNAVDEKNVRYPDMPVEQAVKEGGIMAAAAAEDAKELTGVGLSADLIEEIDTAVAALRFAKPAKSDEGCATRSSGNRQRRYDRG
jgi:hypothetical protein